MKTTGIHNESGMNYVAVETETDIRKPYSVNIGLFWSMCAVDCVIFISLVRQEYINVRKI